MKVPFVDLNRAHNPLKEELNQAINKVISDNSYILGKEVEEFEKNFAAYCDAGYAAGVSTGNNILENSLGSRVISPLFPNKARKISSSSFKLLA